jgi:uncharacterized SAM-binding protein YcdF (DUF218 family)
MVTLLFRDQYSTALPRLSQCDGFFRPIVIYLHKILPVLLLPIGIVLLLVLAGLLLQRRKLIWTGIAFLWLSSTPLVSHLMIRAVEGETMRASAIDALPAEVIVVLSWGRIVAPGHAAISEWGDADRFFGGVELFKAGKAPLLVFTGGRLPWEPKTARLEGEILSEYAKLLGIPAECVVTTSAVMNTAEEAGAVAALLANRRMKSANRPTAARVLLVTSAFHMARSRQLFERAGLKVVPFPVDFQVSVGGALSVIDFLPNAKALSQTEMAWREMYGRLFYLVVR